MSDDLYDFTGVSFDLELLRSELRTLQATTDRHMGFLTKSRIERMEEEEEEEWYPPTPPVYDVADKLIEVNRIFQEDPTSTLHEPNRLRWRAGQALVQIKWMYSDDFENDENRNGIKNIFNFESFSDSKFSEYLNGITSNSKERQEKLESIQSLSDNVKPVSNNMTNGHSSKQDHAPPPPALPKKTKIQIKEEPKPPVKIQPIKPVAEMNGKSSPSPTHRSPISGPPSAPTSGSTSGPPAPPRRMERHKSSDAILTQSLLPPVNRRRHSSQDRLGRTSSKTTITASKVTTNPTVPTTTTVQLNRPKESANSSLTVTKPKSKYMTRSMSDNLHTSSSRLRNSNSFSAGPSETIVLEQVSLVPDNRTKSGLPSSKSKHVDNIGTKFITTNSSNIVSRLRPLRRNISYNSISSNSSVSSQATEDTSLTSSSSSTDSMILKKIHRTPVVITHPRITAEVSMTTTDGAFTQWKERKREEKRLCERRAYLEAQMRRLS